ncbi:MAG: hypothetical protein QM296_06680, partial [Bacillota bacterium]|nr:hypothetical protein [Bacillota bacterium]
LVPRNPGRNEKIVQGWTKIALVPRNRGRNEKIDHPPLIQLAVSTAAFFFIRYPKAAANESIGGSRTGDTCCGCSEIGM